MNYYDDDGELSTGGDARKYYNIIGSQEADYLQAIQPDDAGENDRVDISGYGGSDLIEVSATNASIVAGSGDDVIRIEATSGLKTVYGDLDGDDGEPPVNISYSDTVEIDWAYEDSVITQISHGYEIYNDDLDAVVNIYDVEILKFANEDGSFDVRYLTEGAPIGKDSWMHGYAGQDIAYGDGSSIHFVLTDTLSTSSSSAPAASTPTPQILQVYASVTTHVQEEYTYYQDKKGKISETPFKGAKTKTGMRDVESTEEALIWEGSKTSVDAFNFADGVSINVINIADTNWNDEAIEYTLGTDGIDLIFGNDSDNLIDAGAGDDVIFSGDGDDVIIGGAGDDVIAGGAGDDIIRGDMVDEDDAAISYFEDIDDFDTSSLSIGDDAGDDTILGGDGIDDIDSGDGDNFVSSGRADVDGDGKTDLDVVKEHMNSHQDIFDDDEWI